MIACTCWPPGSCAPCKKKARLEKAERTRKNPADSATRQWFELHGFIGGMYVDRLPDGNEGRIEIEAHRGNGVGHRWVVGIRCDDGVLRYYGKDDLKARKFVRIV